MSVFPGGYTLEQCVEFEKKNDLLEVRVVALEKRNQTLAKLLEKNTEYLLKEIMLLKTQIGPSKKEEKKDDADIDAIVERLSKQSVGEQNPDVPVHVPVKPNRRTPALLAPTNEAFESAKQLGELDKQPSKAVEDKSGWTEITPAASNPLEPYKPRGISNPLSVHLGGLLCGWDSDELRPYLVDPEIINIAVPASATVSGVNPTTVVNLVSGVNPMSVSVPINPVSVIVPKVDAPFVIQPMPKVDAPFVIQPMPKVDAETGAHIQPAVWHTTSIKPDIPSVYESMGITKLESDAASVAHCITLPAKPTSVYESMGITKLESDAASVAHCITLPAKPTSVYESMGIVNAAPTRADITTLTITPDNIEELHHLGEYTSLLTLNCSNLGLTKLPSILPPKLKKLWCDHNALTDFPVLPKSLRELNYSHNKFTRVPSVNVSMVINYGNPWDTDQIPPDERILNRQWELLYKTPIDDILDNPYQTKAHEQPISRKQATPVKKHVVVPTPAPEPRLIMLPKRLSAVPTLDPLIWACSRRNVAHALEFINAAAPICVDKNGDTALIWACANKMPEVALKLVARDLLLGHVDREGNTALIWACVHNMREVIDALMSTDKAKVDHVNRRKQTAKMWIEHHRRNFEAEEAKKVATQSEPNRDVVVEPNRAIAVEPSEPNRAIAVEPSEPNRDIVVEPSAPNRDNTVEPSEPNRDVVVEPETEVRHKKALTIVLKLSSNEALNVAMLAQWRPFKKTYDGKTTYSGYDMRCIETQVPTFYQGHTLYQVPALYPTIAATFSDKPSTRFFDSTTEVNQWLSTVLPRAFALNVPEDAKSEDSFIILETDKV